MLVQRTRVSFLKLLFINSSVVEKLAVKRLVIGSNPTWGEFMVLSFNFIYFFGFYHFVTRS